MNNLWIKVYQWSFILVLISWSVSTYQCASSENSSPTKSNNSSISLAVSPLHGIQFDAKEKIWLQAHKMIKVGTSQYPPLTFMDESNSMAGISADYLKLISKRTGLIFEVDYFAWPELMKNAKNRGIDLFSGLKNQDREKFLTFSEPYLQVSYVVINRLKTPFFNDFSNLNGKKVAVVKNWTVHKLMGKKYPKINIIPFDTVPKALAAVSTRRAEAYVGDLLTASFQIQKNVLINLKIAAPAPFRNDSVRFAIRKDWPELATILNKTLHSLSHEERDTILQNWLLVKFEKGVDWSLVWQWTGGVGSFLCLIIILAVFWNRRLAQLVDEQTNELIVTNKHLEQEIIERNQAEQQQREIKERLAKFMDSATDGFILFDSELYHLEMNKVALEITGLTRANVIGKNVIDVIPNIKETPRYNEYKKVMATGKPFYTRDINKHPLTGEKHIELKAFKVGEGLGVIFTDITERKQAEENVRASKAYLDKILNNIGDPVFVKDNQHKLLIVNDAFCSIFGMPRGEIIGRTLAEDVPPEEQDHFLAIDRQVLTDGKENTCEETLTVKDSKTLTILTKKTRYVDENDNKFLIGVIRDITERKEAEEERKKLETRLHQTQKMETIGTLAGGIAHDFNNILFPIIGHAEILLEDIPGDSQIGDSIKEIFTAAIRASDLVKQILTFARQDNITLKQMKIQPIIKDALKLIRSTIPTTIDIRHDIGNDCGLIKADPTHIHQIVMNLATNAYHAMEDNGGELTVNLKEIALDEQDVIGLDLEPGSYACLTVNDTGIGMNKSVSDKVFEPFFTTKEQGKGTGLGLSVIHGIVKNAGGNINVYSEVGKGTQFNVYLPVVKSSFEQDDFPINELIQGGTEQILLVDDEEPILKMEKQLLERLGYKVISCDTSHSALEIFRATPDKFDLVITDMAMPNIPGDKLAAELIKIRPDIPILLCTGFSGRVPEEKAVSIGIKGFLMKPIVKADLSKKIREVLDD